MKIISSQHYIDWNIVEQKMDELRGQSKVVIPCVCVGVIEGTEYAMQVDGHHTLAAARELGLEISYDIAANDENLEGEAFLEAHWMDGDWYFVEESNPAYNEIVLVW